MSALNYNRYAYAMNNPLVYIDQDGELADWIIGLIIGVFFYAKAAHDNTPKADQGNPLKWNWLPWNWGWDKANYVVSVGNNTGPSGGIGVSGSFGWDNNSMINIGYNRKSGPGMGIGQAGTTNMYYPWYDYDKPEKAAMAAIQQSRQDYNNYKQFQKAWDWVKNHFYTAAQGEISYGLQVAGSFDKGIGINFSPVHDILIEGNISNKDDDVFYLEGEGSMRKILDFGLSYYAGINYRGLLKTHYFSQPVISALILELTI